MCTASRETFAAVLEARSATLRALQKASSQAGHWPLGSGGKLSIIVNGGVVMLADWFMAGCKKVRRIQLDENKNVISQCL